MDKCNKIKHTCAGSRNYATCIDWEGTVNTQSELDSEDCLNMDEVTQDIYNQLEEIDLSALGEECLTYFLDVNSKTIVKNVLLKFEKEICNLKTEVAELKNKPICDMPLGDCVDTLCLVDDCGDPISTFGQLLQIMITKQCTP